MQIAAHIGLAKGLAGGFAVGVAGLVLGILRLAVQREEIALGQVRERLSVTGIGRLAQLGQAHLVVALVDVIAQLAQGLGLGALLRGLGLDVGRRHAGHGARRAALARAQPDLLSVGCGARRLCAAGRHGAEQVGQAGVEPRVALGRLRLGTSLGFLGPCGLTFIQPVPAGQREAGGDQGQEAQMLGAHDRAPYRLRQRLRPLA